jgi:putative membrane protein
VIAASRDGYELGALLAFASTPWYPAHAEGAAHWGITPLDAQQLAGLIMWVPGGLLYLTAMALLFLAWIERRPAGAWRARGEAAALDPRPLRG